MSHIIPSSPSLPGPGDASLFDSEAGLAVLERDILPAFVSRARWFGGKARDPQRFLVREVLPLGDGRLVFVEVGFAAGPSETYLLPLHLMAGKAAEVLATAAPSAIVAHFANGTVLTDALHEESFRAALFALMLRSSALHGDHGTLTTIAGPALAGLTAVPASRALAVEQSNSSVIYGDHIFLKLYRKLEEGINPDPEILHFLSGRGFPYVPPFGGAIEYTASGGGTRVLAVALGLVPNDGDAWSFTLRHLADYYGQVLAGDRTAAADLKTEYLSAAAQLGQRTGEMHLALAGGTDAPDFAPEPFTANDGAQLSAALEKAVEEIPALVARRLEHFDTATRTLAEQLIAAQPALHARATAIATLATSSVRTRTHGDYHLGQVLYGPQGFIIIDFEGEPLRALAERRRKMSPFRDVAGMLRSFHYAAHAALEPLAEQRASLETAAEQWHAEAAATFLLAWQEATAGAVFRDRAAEQTLLDAFLLEKALYEVRYEANNRPTWLSIPLRGVLALLS